MQRRFRRPQAGFVSVELMVAVSLSFVFLVFVCNIIFIQYGRGVIRAAADEGARVGSRVNLEESVDPTLIACQNRANELLDSLGKMAIEPQVTCEVDELNQRVNATVTAKFEPWMPWIPEVNAEATASSLKEQAPA